jgi:hypothetical protein
VLVRGNDAAKVTKVLIILKKPVYGVVPKSKKGYLYDSNT